MSRLTRSYFLLFTSLVCHSGVAQTVAVDAESVVEYVEACRKDNGAFGPRDQPYTDAAWNYPAVRTLLLLGKRITNPQAILKHGLDYPGGHVGYGHWHFFHQHAIRSALGKPMIVDYTSVRLVHQGFEVRYYGSPFGFDGDTFFKAPSGSEPDPRDSAASELGYYNLSSLYYTLAGMLASGRKAKNPHEMIQFINARQSPSGGFVDVRTKDGQPINEQAHVAHTWHALASLQILGEPYPHADRCAAFLRSCQLSSGGFRWSPKDDALGNYADVYYTWSAILALRLLRKEPKDVQACQEWINSLQNDDGGFGDQPGWRSRLYSTFYATEALERLTSSARDAITGKQRKKRVLPQIPGGQYSIYQGLCKVPVVSHDDLAGLQKRGFSLLALKSDDFSLVDPLRQFAHEMNPKMDVVLCPEAYPHRTRRFGGTVLHHIANPTLNPATQATAWKKADAEGRKGLDWPAYQHQVIRPLQQAGSLIYPEQDFEMELAYSAYDDGVYKKHGYNAVLAGFNWSPRDFVRVFPWRERYVNKLTPIADADAHGDLKKWSPQLDHTRHLFIARGPTYADFQEAAAGGRVVCVIYGSEGIASEATFYGPRPAVDYVKRHIDQWKWWDDK